MVIQFLNNLKTIAISSPLVAMSSVSSIIDYENKPDIKYPFVNIDLVSLSVQNYSKLYKVRIYICDRNPNEFNSYNKSAIILDDILKTIGIEVNNYTANFFRLDFLDMVNGCWSEVDIEGDMVLECDGLLDSKTYVVTEQGDYVVDETNSNYIVSENNI